MHLTGNISRFNLSGQDLTGAELGIARSVNLAGANLTNALLLQITGANLTNATITGATIIAYEGSPPTLTFAQMAGTASYRNRNLRGVALRWHDLSNWNLSNQDLTGVDLGEAILSGANFSGAGSRAPFSLRAPCMA